jgi:hypothetical protein
VDEEDAEQSKERDVAVLAEEDAPAQRVDGLGRREQQQSGEGPPPVCVGKRRQRVADIDPPGQ